MTENSVSFTVHLLFWAINHYQQGTITLLYNSMMIGILNLDYILYSES